MRIQPDDVVVGFPVLAIRKLLKYVQRYPWGTLETIAKQLEIETADAERVYQRLLDEGYIEPYEPFAGYQCWYLTWKGSSLANASKRKPITRKTAKRLVEEFLARVREVNASDYAYRVGKVIVFGSFLSDAPTLGDIDLSIELVDPYRDGSAREVAHKARITLAEQTGRSFRDYMSSLRWPEQEVLLKLKKHSPSLSLHYEWREQILTKPIPSKILFDASVPEDVGSDPLPK